MDFFMTIIGLLAIIVSGLIFLAGLCAIAVGWIIVDQIVFEPARKLKGKE